MQLNAAEHEVINNADDDAALTELLTQLHAEAETKISANDYRMDSEFSPVYEYLSSGRLTGDDKKDKKTLLMADQYTARNGLLFRLQLPRHRRSEGESVVERLCVPRLFRLKILHRFHDTLGHFGTRRIFSALYPRFFWQTLFSDLEKYVRTCDLCMKSKRNASFRHVPLNPVAVPEAVFLRWGVDFKSLVRKTPSGFTAIMICVDIFSNFVKLILLKNLHSQTAAKAFVQSIICSFGLCSEIQSDRGANLTSRVFQAMVQLLKIKHKISASRRDTQ